VQLLGGSQTKLLNNAYKYIIKNNFTKENDNLDNGEQPVAIVMVGTPGAGKSTCLTKLKSDLSDDFLSQIRKEKLSVVNADGVMEAIYKIPSDADELPFGCRGLSNGINDFCFKLAKRYKRDIVYDATGKDYYPHVGKINELHEAGYKIVLCIVMIDRPTNLSRVRQRNQQIQEDVAQGRPARDQTPTKFVGETYDSILTVIEQYMIIPKIIINLIYVYDNSSANPLLIIKRNENGDYECPQKGNPDENNKVLAWFHDINVCRPPPRRADRLRGVPGQPFPPAGIVPGQLGGKSSKKYKNRKTKNRKTKNRKTKKLKK
jgi:predicted ABC-type ATPase